MDRRWTDRWQLYVRRYRCTMAAQIPVLFLLCLSVLFSAGSANCPDNAKVNDDEVTWVKINELFDSMLPAIQRFILENELDPLKLKNIYETLQGVLLQKSLYLSNGWLQGLSNVRRAGDVIFSYKNKVLTLDAVLAFDVAGISYQYLYKDLLISRNGGINGQVNNMQIRVIVELDMNNYKVVVPVSKIVKINKFSITFEGNELDPLVNAALKVIADVFRTKIINMVDQEFSKAVQAFVREINGKISPPHRILNAYPKLNLV